MASWIIEKDRQMDPGGFECRSMTHGVFAGSPSELQVYHNPSYLKNT
jgi:hypothetical protein